MNIDPGTVYQQFIEEHLELELLGETVFYGDRVYQSSVGASRLEGLKVIRPGWFMGTVKRKVCSVSSTGLCVEQL